MPRPSGSKAAKRHGQPGPAASNLKKVMKVMKPMKSMKVEKVKNPKKKKRGQADSLVGGAWKAWVKHLERTGPTWLYIFTIMSHCLCARVTEVMRLTLANVDFESGTIHIDSLKRQASIDKPMLKALLDQMATWKQNGGVKFTRTRKCGSRGLVTFQDHWYWPTESQPEFFPAVRKDCEGKSMNKASWIKQHVFLSYFNYF